LQTALSHLIGTTAALGIMSALIAASFQISAYQRINIAKRELQEVTDYISQNLYDLIQTAVNFSSTDDVVWKRVNVPIAASDEKAYSIALSNVSGSISVTAWVDAEPLIKASAILPVNCTNAKIRVNAMEAGTQLFPDGHDLVGVIVKTRLTSGSSLPVIWIKVTSDGAMIGLGWMKE